MYHDQEKWDKVLTCPSQHWVRSSYQSLTGAWTTVCSSQISHTSHIVFEILIHMSHTICKCWIIVIELYTWSSISSKLDEDLDIKTNRRIIVQILKFKQLNFHEEFWQRTEEFHLAFCADICPTYLLFTWRTLLWTKSCFKTIIIT